MDITTRSLRFQEGFLRKNMDKRIWENNLEFKSKKEKIDEIW